MDRVGRFPLFFLAPVGRVKEFCMKITELVAQLAAEPAAQAGCFVWDVEFLREGGERYLRVSIDNDAAQVNIDQCEAVSKALDVKLDELDPIQESYILEVCSAGAERALRRPEDFRRFLGSPVTVKLYSARDGRKEFPGVLKAWEEGDVVLEDGARFRKSEVAQVRLRVTF